MEEEPIAKKPLYVHLYILNLKPMSKKEYKSI
jgi:hypothetical protein